MIHFFTHNVMMIAMIAIVALNSIAMIAIFFALREIDKALRAIDKLSDSLESRRAASLASTKDMAKRMSRTTRIVNVNLARINCTLLLPQPTDF